MRTLFIIFAILLILKLVGVAQIAWWMIAIPAALIFVLFIFMVWMDSGGWIILNFKLMEMNRKSIQKREAKESKRQEAKNG